MPRPDPVLIGTKFSKPPSRPEFVERHRLLDRLDEAVDQHRVTLVSAPPGFGKTTLATQWLARQSVPTAWLALDSADSDPERFVRYLVAAVEESIANRLPKSRALLGAQTPPPFEYLCEVLVSELTAIGTRLVLVLEDYHTVESKPVHGLIERVVQTMVPSMRLLVLSRVDPAWPLGHWRAQGWLGELRARDLRFSLEEARRFFAADRRGALSSSTIEKLHARAEGWIAALRLMQLSLQGSPQPEERAREFSGSDRLVADYLMAEVLAIQPPAIRRFLTVTAPLSRFSAPLCDHLLASPDAEPPAREILARVLHLNLFLVPLDADGEWYRYHHLFQDLLLHHLPDLARPERRADIERRAAEWFAREGLVEEAALQRWLSLFPAGAERGRLPLLVAHAYFRMAKWDLRGMGELIDEAARLLRTSRPRRSPPAASRFQADVDALAAFMHYWNGNPTSRARRAKGLSGPRSPALGLACGSGAARHQTLGSV